MHVQIWETKEAFQAWGVQPCERFKDQPHEADRWRLEILHAALSCHMVRRTKLQVFPEFPKPYSRYWSFEDDNATREKLVAVLGFLSHVKDADPTSFSLDMMGEDAGVAEEGGKPNARKIYQRMRIIAQHPATDVVGELDPSPGPKNQRPKLAKEIWSARLQKITQSNHVQPCARFQEAVNILLHRRRQTTGIKSLVFSPFSRANDLFLLWEKKKLVDYDGKIFMISGDKVPNVKNRMAIIEQFHQAPPESILIATKIVLQEGLNITCANHVMFLGLTWSPINEEQALCRSWRLGQTSSVFIDYLLSNSMIDQKMWDKSKEKQRYAKIVVYGGHIEKLPSAFEPDIEPSEVWTKFDPKYPDAQRKDYGELYERFRSGTMPACEVSYGQGLAFGEHQLGHPKLPLDRGEKTDKRKFPVYSIGKSNIG